MQKNNGISRWGSELQLLLSGTDLSAKTTLVVPVSPWCGQLGHFTLPLAVALLISPQSISICLNSCHHIPSYPTRNNFASSLKIGDIIQSMLRHILFSSHLCTVCQYTYICLSISRPSYINPCSLYTECLVVQHDYIWQTPKETGMLNKSIRNFKIIWMLFYQIQKPYILLAVCLKSASHSFLLLFFFFLLFFCIIYLAVGIKKLTFIFGT